MPKIAITQNHRIEIAINDALAPPAVEPLIRGKAVAVHPNNTWASAHPAIEFEHP